MTPIINPMWFYWINFVGNLSVTIGFIVVSLILGLIIYLASKGITMDSNRDYFVKSKPVEADYSRSSNYTDDVKWHNNYLRHIKTIKLIVIVIIVLSIFSITIPSETTMYRMMVARMATKDNIAEVTQAIKDSVDYIFDKVNGK